MYSYPFVDFETQKDAIVEVGLTYDLKGKYLVQGFTEEEAAEFDSPDTIIKISQLFYKVLSLWQEPGY